MQTLDDIRSETTDGRLVVNLPGDVIVRMLIQCQGASDRETGGMLVGRYSADHHAATITGLSSVPSDSRQGRFWFYRGVKGLKKWLDSLWHRGSVYYLGEWHFHPYASAKPSGTDRKQMLDIARSERYRCPEPILVIVGGNPSGKYEISVTVFNAVGAASALVVGINADA